MRKLAAVLLLLAAPSHAGKFALQHGRWLHNGTPTHPGTAAEGRLLSVRRVNCTFDDQNPATRPDGFDPAPLARLRRVIEACHPARSLKNHRKTSSPLRAATLMDPRAPAPAQATTAPQASLPQEPAPWT
jgi:hypothetical protein